MPPDDLDLIAAVDDPTPEQQRIAAALADLDQIVPTRHNCADYGNECWRWHAGCLAAWIRRTLTEGDHHAA